MKTWKPLSIAYTPDSDDAFYYDALEPEVSDCPASHPGFSREPMSVLNRAALQGRYEVTAISSVLYPQIADQYVILSVGTSVGRGYGPVLVSREPLHSGRTATDVGSVCPASRPRAGSCCVPCVRERCRSKWPSMRSQKRSPRRTRCRGDDS